MESGYQSDSGYVPAYEIETRYISSNGTDEERIIPDIYPGSITNGFYTRPSTIASTYQFKWEYNLARVKTGNNGYGWQ